MRSFLRNFVITGAPFGIWMGIYFALTESSLEDGLWMGLYAGVFFGFVMAAVAWVQERRASSSLLILTDENLMREGPASFRGGKSGCAGRLYLTDKRLLFEAYPMGKPVEQISIPIHEIVGLKRRSVFGVFPVLLEVTLKNDKPKTFNISDVKDWIEEIAEVRQDYLEAPPNGEVRLFA